MNDRVSVRGLSRLVIVWLAWVAACTPAAVPGPAAAPAAVTGKPGAEPAAPPAPQQKTDVGLRLAYLARGYDAPFYVARAKGFYDEAGLNVEINEGQGSVTTLGVVDSGHADFGEVDAAVLLAGAGKGVQSTMVFMHNQRSPIALIFLSDAGINSPQDLRGKSIGTVPGASVTLLLPLYLDKVGLPRESVNVVSVDAAGKVPAFRSRRFDLMTGLLNDQVGELEAAGETIQSLGFADAGVNTVSLGVVVRNDFIRSNRPQTERFVAATRRAWEAVIQNPDEAVGVLAEAFPQYSPVAFKSQLVASIPLVHTANTEGKPIGWMAKEDWEETQALLLRSDILTQSVNVADLYTNEFNGNSP